MMLNYYIIMGFEATEEFPLGAFKCQPVGSKVRDERMIAFIGTSRDQTVYFDPELLCYVLVIDDEYIDAPYKPLDDSF